MHHTKLEFVFSTNFTNKIYFIKRPPYLEVVLSISSHLFDMITKDDTQLGWVGPHTFSHQPNYYTLCLKKNGGGGLSEQPEDWWGGGDFTCQPQPPCGPTSLGIRPATSIYSLRFQSTVWQWSLVASTFHSSITALLQQLYILSN